jgi:hypothetical protein
VGLGSCAGGREALLGVTKRAALENKTTRPFGPGRELSG